MFNNLGHLIDQSMLKEQFQHLDGNKAAGIDRVTKADWGEQGVRLENESMVTPVFATPILTISWLA